MQEGKMFRSLFIFITILILVSACAPATQSMPIPVIDNTTATSSPISTATRTALPSATQTASITPLPTVPTFTPTFDVSTILTVTPAPKAECPKENPYPEKEFNLIKFVENGNYKNTQEAILVLLNNYGPEVLVDYERNEGTTSEEMVFRDFTNDGIPELALRLTVGLTITTFDIFGCRDRKYQDLLSIPSNGLGFAPIIFSAEDNNKNGIHELTILTSFLSQGGHYFEIYEWDGENFAVILSPFYQNDPNSNYLWVEATGELHYDDIDSDFVNELILDSGVPVWETYWSGLPWRNKRTYYKWNGQNYSPYKIEFAQPEFRFQALQDGDLAFSQKEYDKALDLYQQAIFSEKLDGYSVEIRENLRAIWDAGFGTNPTPTPYPISADEYPRLAAYAYYRIMLLHLVENHKSDANTVYNTLQEKFGNDQYGHSYVEMATMFWNAYQSTRKMYDGCAAAIEYAVEHPDILIPLGSDYHGAQSHRYKPEDMCPFR